MSDETRNPVDELRGVSRLAIDATKGVTALVEAMHRTIAGGPQAPADPVAKVVYGGVRGVTSVVGAGLDLALGQLAPILSASVPGEEREVVLSVVNGVLGDYLDQTRNPLALPMQLRYGGRALAVEDAEAMRAGLTRASGRMLVVVHGSCMAEHQWLRGGHDHGLALTRDAGWTRIGARYNSGLHVSDNGALLAAKLETLVRAWPVPVEAVALLAHSMGGLVSRSACAVGEAAGHAWRSRLRTLVTLGTPHHGAPLERGGNWIDAVLGGSRYAAPLARLGKIRSAGVTDLRYGNVLPEHWLGRDRFERGGDPRCPTPLPAGVRCHAVAASLGAGLGDGLVPIDSALGRHRDPAQALGFADEDTLVVGGAGHLDLLNHPEVYAKLQAWLSGS